MQIDNVSTQPNLIFDKKTKLQWSLNTYLPYRNEANNTKLSIDSLGQRLVYGDRGVISSYPAYLLWDNATETVIRTYPIPQNEDGMDTEDRILLLKKLISTKELLFV